MISVMASLLVSVPEQSRGMGQALGQPENCQESGGCVPPPAIAGSARIRPASRCPPTLTPDSDRAQYE